jgi:type I restriction enzyme S subunit
MGPKGSSPTMKKISQSIVAGIPFPSSISLHQRESVVQELDALQTKVLALKTLQNKTDVELEAMLPAILNQSFSGKL